MSFHRYNYRAKLVVSAVYRLFFELLSSESAHSFSNAGALFKLLETSICACLDGTLGSSKFGGVIDGTSIGRHGRC